MSNNCLCNVERTMSVVGGKWKGTILFNLLNGEKRFGELCRLLPGATQRMVTLQLRELERDGIIARTIYPQIPPKVEYALTEFGATLKPMILLMSDWGAEHREQLEARQTTDDL